MIYQFRFWKEWCDKEGRLWAEPYTFETPTDARRSHDAALGWHWCEGKLRPSVSDLVSTAFVEDPTTGKKRAENSTTIKDGATREYHEATLTASQPAGRRER